MGAANTLATPLGGGGQEEVDLTFDSKFKYLIA